MKKWFIIGVIGSILLAVILTITVQIIIEENTQKQIHQQGLQTQEEMNTEITENELEMTSTIGEDQISPNAEIGRASCRERV